MRPPLRKLARPKQEPEKTLSVQGEFLTLGQLLKWETLIETGGEAKLFLAEHTVLVNGERDERRGRKLRPGDTVLISGVARYRIEAAAPGGNSPDD